MEPLLSRLESYDYDILMANSKQISVGKGEYIFKEGDPSNYLYFVLKGEIRIFKYLGKHKEITIFTRGKQDGFGEIGIFSGEKYSNSALAQKDSLLCCISKKDIETILSHNGRLGIHVTQWLAESLEASKAKMRDFIAFGSEGAVASVFVRYSNMYGIVTPEGIRITEPIMIRDISKHIGISRETVSRIINKWKEEGIISNNNKYFLLKNVDYFKELLFCENCGVENCVI
ncbi:Crp/Fnr family transcriptional regulator [Virgibacillus byunsanensis]|uniref:Crp/Fnr family transcriptional regulator n=1 Tax=Virgibacillus byunsanensis TaxID=570945 RepID=A0ABW3LI13_9BACI